MHVTCHFSLCGIFSSTSVHPPRSVLCPASSFRHPPAIFTTGTRCQAISFPGLPTPASVSRLFSHAPLGYPPPAHPFHFFPAVVVVILRSGESSHYPMPGNTAGKLLRNGSRSRTGKDNTNFSTHDLFPLR